MRPRRSAPLRLRRCLRSRVGRLARLGFRVALLVWFTATSLGIPLAQAAPRDSDEKSLALLLVGERPATSPSDAAAEAAALPDDELCVLPELLIPSRKLAHCGCSLSLQTAGRCCCAAVKPAAAKNCCTARRAAAPESERPHGQPREQDRAADRFACVTCPCGSGSDAWIIVAAEPRVLGDLVVLAPGGRPLERLVAIAAHLPQIFLSPDTPPPRPGDGSPTAL